MGIAALVLGIVGLLGSFVPCLGMYAIPLTVLAVILGFVGMRAPKDGSPAKGKGMAIAGLVCGLLGTIMASYWIYLFMTHKGAITNELRRGFNEGIQKSLREQEKRNQEKLDEEKPDPVKPDEAKPDEALPEHK